LLGSQWALWHLQLLLLLLLLCRWGWDDLVVHHRPWGDPHTSRRALLLLLLGCRLLLLPLLPRRHHGRGCRGLLLLL
jgi:hypothetical protein